MSLATRNDYDCLSYGTSGDEIRLVLPAGSSVDAAPSLATGIMDVVSVLAKNCALGLPTENGGESLGHAMSWLAEIAFGITEGVREDLLRIARDLPEDDRIEVPIQGWTPPSKTESEP